MKGKQDDMPTREELMSMDMDAFAEFDAKHPRYVNELMMQGVGIRQSAGAKARQAERERRDAQLRGDDD
jgi:hypothetical protein